MRRSIFFNVQPMEVKFKHYFHLYRCIYCYSATRCFGLPLAKRSYCCIPPINLNSPVLQANASICNPFPHREDVSV